MVKVHLLGHSYISHNGQPLKLSAKAVALLIYLSNQQRPVHREHLADLLWDTPDSLRNLRVELAKLHQLGLELLPVRTSLLSLKLTSDLDEWLAEADGLPELRLSEWLSQGSQMPLSGLEDTGSAAFGEWVDAQRWAITQQIETALAGMQRRALQSGSASAAALIRSRAEQLGLELRSPGPLHPPSSQVYFARPGVQQRLQEVLAQARENPQLLLFTGRDDQAKREAVARAAGAKWQVIEMQVFSRPELQQAAFFHQLARVLPPELQAAARQLVRSPGEPGDDLVQAWTLIAASGVPMIVNLHGIHSLPSTLMSSLRFALELPTKLLVVMCVSSPATQESCRDACSRFDLNRVHLLKLPPLSGEQVQDALDQRQTHFTPDQRLRYANLIAQQSDGWDRHAQALIHLGLALPELPLSVPDEIRDILLGQLSTLSPELRRALPRWAMVHAPLTLELARLLSGDQAGTLLRQASDLGLLLPAAPEESVLMPHLLYRHSDAEAQLCFCSEPLRAALASSLSSQERRELREVLARTFLDTQPALALAYARRAGLGELAQQIRHSPPSLGAAPIIAGLTNFSPEALPHAPEQPECRTANGYRVLLHVGQLTVLRNGLYAPAPLLRLRWPQVAPGHWTMLARLDVQHAPLDLSERVSYALGIRSGHGPRHTYSALPTAPYVDAGIKHQPSGLLPLGQWVRLSGEAGPGELELTMRSLDLALTIAEVNWNDNPLFFPKDEEALNSPLVSW